MKRLVKKLSVLLIFAILNVGLSGCTVLDRSKVNSEFTAIVTTSGTFEVTYDDFNSHKEEITTGDIISKEQGIFTESDDTEFNVNDVPIFNGTPYAVVNDNIPFFQTEELSVKSFEFYSDLDDLDRCGVAYACVGKDIMPTEERGYIGNVKPSGWHTIKYENIDGKYLYNRCHLIGYQLCGENANEKNLITGTRYLNVEGMLPFENMTADYVIETGNHVMYRVTPIFEGNNLLATGVLMEGYSVEDSGAGICFNVFCYNAQPDIKIDYTNGESQEMAISFTSMTSTIIQSEIIEEITYILNINTKKFHYPYCSSVEQMKDKNKREYFGDREDIISQGYSPCKNCNP